MLQDYSTIFQEYIDTLRTADAINSPLYTALLREAIEIGTMYKASLNMLINFCKKTKLNVSEYQGEVSLVTRELEKLHMKWVRTPA